MARVATVILRQMPDILTMQEVDCLEELMGDHGLGQFYKSSIWYKKDVVQSYKMIGVADGVAVLWNQEKFEIVGRGGGPLPACDKQGKNKYLKDTDKDGEKVHDSKQIWTYVKLQCRDETKKTFIVVTAHLKSGDNAEDKFTKKAQAKFMAKQMKNLSENETIPVVCAADFNTNPGTEAFQAFVENTTGSFESAYPFKPEKNEEGGAQNKTPTTSYKFRRGGDQPGKCKPISQAIDFIFHSKQWKCARTLSIPKELQELVDAKCAGLPNWRYPSDHVMIGAELELTV